MDHGPWRPAHLYYSYLAHINKPVRIDAMKDYQSITTEIETVHELFTDQIATPLTDNTRDTTEHQHDIILESQDHLAPPFDSTERKSNVFVASFNLIATIVGGVVLSLPIVFHKCGIAFTTIAMILSAYMTYLSLLMLCLSSRKGGGSSYGEVIRSAFGEKMEEVVSWLLFVFLFFVIIGYMVLIRDIWTPIVQQVFALDMDGDTILLVITILLLPCIFQRSLHALRWNCYVGSMSIFVLCIALNRGGWQRMMHSSSPSILHDDNSATSGFTIEFWKIPSIEAILFSFPITTCAFLCQFNIIAVQNSLLQPTRERTKQVIRYAIGASFLLMYMFGFGGYLYAGNNPQGNILLNIPISKQVGEDEGEHFLFLIGRIGSGITIMLAMPMIALPCREALLEVVDIWYHRSHHTTNLVDNARAKTGTGKFHWKLFHWCSITPSTVQYSYTPIVTEDEMTEILSDSIEEHDIPRSSILIRHEPIQKDYIFRNALAHYGSSVVIITTCYLGAVAVNGVDAVWSFIGSTMAFMIAFVLPCGSFIAIENSFRSVADGGEPRSISKQIAWAILISSVLGSFVCTMNSFLGTS